MSENKAPCYTADEKILRSLLWSNHGHTGLYGDDGEMQCPKCGLDFKRDSVVRICELFVLQSMKLLEDLELKATTALEEKSELTGTPRCCVCRTTEKLHKDGWYGYRCDSPDCACF